MELNRLVFPRPKSSYTHESMRGKILYIPKIKTAFEKIAAATKLTNLNFASSLLMDSTNVN